MRYELWELSTGNLVGAYETEAAALRAVAEAIRRCGPAAPAAWPVRMIALSTDRSLCMRAARATRLGGPAARRRASKARIGGLWRAASRAAPGAPVALRRRVEALVGEQPVAGGLADRQHV